MKRGSCVFCGDFGDLHEEDVIPRWAARELQRLSGAKAVLFTTRKVAGEGGEVLKTYQTKYGNVAAFKLPIVCQPCNGGWMKRIEDDAAELIKPMIRGVRTELRTTDQVKLATWAALKVLTFDLVEHSLASDSRTAGTADLAAFRRDRIPPPEFFARLGHLQGFGTESCLFSWEPTITRDEFKDVPANTPFGVTFLLTLGPVIVQAHFVNQAARQSLPLPLPLLNPQPQWTPIWPSLPTAVNWPPPVGVTPDQIPSFEGEWPDLDTYLQGHAGT